jgi:hypothetical protein
VTGRPALRVIEGSTPEDSVTRRHRFEREHPDVTIVAPGNQWHAIVPLGKIPGRPDGTTISSLNLTGLMDQLEGIYPPEGGQGL